MAFSRDDSEYDDISLAKFKHDSIDLTRQALTFHSHANGHETTKHGRDLQC